LGFRAHVESIPHLLATLIGLLVGFSYKLRIQNKQCVMFIVHGCSLRQIIFIGFPYQGKDIVLRFIIEYPILMDFGPYVIALFL
jgi:hypothetical protein